MTNTDELRQKRSAIQKGGGSESINEQHNVGKLTARERLEKLFDEGTFIEVDTFVKSRENFNLENAKESAEGVVSGYGSVRLRPRLYCFKECTYCSSY